ncbi:hypothetical protein HMPREF0682_1802 [Propionibacterium acidifaciens F0233]|uniref:Uncharacterized protein n=1 Tax=Propionibacterium acidifaciens F0233 TaxID=553198 RepID=U2Q8P1_9ACTN|nr:hypothetical protein HMPREF0682_1802 [Propionibacterium acidifaciens F0233]
MLSGERGQVGIHSQKRFRQTGLVRNDRFLHDCVRHRSRDGIQTQRCPKVPTGCGQHDARLRLPNDSNGRVTH